jgi:hypothetical protein
MLASGMSGLKALTTCAASCICQGKAARGQVQAAPPGLCSVKPGPYHSSSTSNGCCATPAPHGAAALPGDPKGVLLKHSAVVATVNSLISFLDCVPEASMGVGDSMLSYLPLAHIFDR